MEELKTYIREVPDFPRPGIRFYDITTLFENPEGFQLALDHMETYVRRLQPKKVVAVDSRGFVFGAPLADRLKLAFIPIRKQGKLPRETIGREYELEYGKDRLEIHSDAIVRGERVVVIDDLIATGGTLKATCNLVEKLGGIVAGICCVIGLDFLPFRHVLAEYDVNCLITYQSI